MSLLLLLFSYPPFEGAESATNAEALRDGAHGARRAFALVDDGAQALRRDACLRRAGARPQVRVVRGVQRDVRHRHGGALDAVL